MIYNICIIYIIYDITQLLPSTVQGSITTACVPNRPTCDDSDHWRDAVQIIKIGKDASNVE